jgi:glucose/arabinose dehydrogenase
MVRPLLSALIAVCIIAAAATSVAHPPWAPYDDSRFAPILSFGPKIGIAPVARGENNLAGNPIGPTLVSPLKVVSTPSLPNHIFIVDQVGIIWTLNLTTGNRTEFLNVSFEGSTRPERIIELGVCGPGTFDERGLLGLAFHPNFRNNGKFYTYTSELADIFPATIPKAVPFDADHQNVVSEYAVPAANRADPAFPETPGVFPPRRELMRVDWPQFNHDGGDLAFGPDRKLYISMGDGGAADDADTGPGQQFILARPKYAQPQDCGPIPLQAPITGHQGSTARPGNAQKLNTALGKIHRIDVDGVSPPRQYVIPADNPFRTGPVPEIWAYGFRNPYRMSFDSKKGDLYVGDVGQNDIEEVDIVTRGGNFGWNCKEGTLWFWTRGDLDGKAMTERDTSRPECDRRVVRLTDPVSQYDTHHEGHSVIGGYVYHGKAIPALKGRYVFGDFALLFKFPRGPHDYGRLFVQNAGRAGRGLHKISEIIVLPGGAVSLAVLGSGVDAKEELYVTGNVFGVPFGNNGVVVKLVSAPEADNDDDDGDDHGRGHGRGRGDHDD